MRTRRKKFLYIMFLLITVLMFLHSWKSYIRPSDATSAEYAKKHHKKKLPIQHKQHYRHQSIMHV